VKCEICGQDFANSEEIKAHMERDHTLDETGDEELEKPDMMREEEGAEAQRAPAVPGKDN